MAEQSNTPLYGTQAVSPEALKLRRQIAADLLKQGADTSPIRSPWQGAARMAQTLVGALQSGQLDKQEMAMREKLLQDAIDYRDKGDPARLLANPYATPEVLRLAAETRMPRMIDQGTGTVPVNPNTGYPAAPTIPKNNIGQISAGGASTPTVVQGAPYSQQFRPPQAPMAPQQRPPMAPQPGGVGGGAPMPARPFQPPQPPQVQPGAANGPANFNQRFDAAYRPQLESLAGVGRDIGSANAGREAQDAIRKSDIAASAAAPEQLTHLGFIRSIFGGPNPPVTGPVGETWKNLKQAITGVTGKDFDAAPAEVVTKLNRTLASEAAKGLRGTNLDLETMLGAQPGNLMNTPRGTMALADIIEQQRKRDRDLGPLAANPKNFDTYVTDRNSFIQGYPIRNPLTGHNLDQDLANLPPPGQRYGGAPLTGANANGWSVRPRGQ